MAPYGINKTKVDSIVLILDIIFCVEKIFVCMSLYSGKIYFFLVIIIGNVLSTEAAQMKS